MNVAIYIRKSREDKEETKESTLERHERILKEYCNKYELKYTESSIYREVVSGDSISNRPQMQKLLQDVENNLYDGVVVVEVQRLSRGNGIDQEIIKETFKRSRTLIYTLNKVYDLFTGDEIDEDMLELSLFLSRQELKAIKRRMMRGRIQAQKEGYYTHPVPPFGYDKEKQGKGYVLVPNETEAEIIRMMYHWYIHDEKRMSDIRDYLNNNNIRTRRGNKWDVQVVRNLMKSKVYLGFLNVDNKKNQRHCEGKHQAIISEETYNLAMQKLKSNTPKTKNGKNLRNPLAGIIKCALCGKTLALHYVPSKNNYNLQCDNLDCNNIGAYLHFIEDKVIDELKQELKNFNYFLSNSVNEINKLKDLNNKEIKIIEKNIAKKKEMVERCCEMLEEGIYTKERYIERVSILENDLSVLETQLYGLKSKEFNEETKIRTAIPILENVLNEYPKLTPPQKNQLLRTIIEKIEYIKTQKKSPKALIDDKFKLKIHLKI